MQTPAINPDRVLIKNVTNSHGFNEDRAFIDVGHGVEVDIPAVVVRADQDGYRVTSKKSRRKVRHAIRRGRMKEGHKPRYVNRSGCR